jgi:hypothetical protein
LPIGELSDEQTKYAFELEQYYAGPHDA